MNINKRLHFALGRTFYSFLFLVIISLVGCMVLFLGNKIEVYIWIVGFSFTMGTFLMSIYDYIYLVETTDYNTSINKKK